MKPRNRLGVYRARRPHAVGFIRRCEPTPPTWPAPQAVVEWERGNARFALECDPRRRGWLAAALALLVVVAVLACGTVDHASARAANALAVASNAALPLVVERYRAEQLEQLDAGGGDAGEIETRNRVIEVRHQWGPVWMAWEAYRVAFGIYADALDRGDSDGAADALERMRLTACAFRHAVPLELAPKLPALPVRCP